MSLLTNNHLLMKHLLSLVLSIVCISVAVAQTQLEKLFTKYGDKKGVEISVTSQPPVKDTIRNTLISTVITAMTVNAEAEDDEKGKSKLYDKVKNDCVKLFKNKNYVVIRRDKDDDESFTVYKYAKNGIVEMCVLTINDDELTLDSTKISGLSKEAMNNVEFKIKK
jgi:hypothetical protein